MFQSPGEVAFSLIGLPVYYYGVIMAVAVFAGFCVSAFLYSKLYDKAGAEKIIDISPLLIVSGIIGARMYYCALNLGYYSEYPSQILNLRQGGLSLHGMIFLGVIILYVCVKKNGMDFLKIADVMACGTALAQSIGRWGNFFNSEAFGLPTDLPWKLFIPPYNRPAEFINYDYFHPTFLYESILDFIIFLILISIVNKSKQHPGLIFGIYLILYSIARIGIEYLRVDSALTISGIPVAQLVSGLIIIFSLLYIKFVVYKRQNVKS